MTLEDQLLEAAKRGMTHLALYPVPSVDGKTTYWTATAAPSTQHHYVRATELSPVAALTKVLADLPKARSRAAPKTETVTAAVTPDANERDQQDPAADWMLKP